MFIDHVRLKLIAGKGGDGVIAWRREKYLPKGGPCGGNGGRGGDIYLHTDSGLYSLESFRNKKSIRAENGQPGGSNLCQGKSGKDLLIRIPCGTIVKDAETGTLLYDLTNDDQKILLCKGGKGGKGNDFFKTSTHQAPRHCTPGKPGETKEIELELKLIADMGFIGLPNAGKSTLLSKITTFQAKIGAYPFTTLKPNLSYIEFENLSRLYIADIPGIIKNAHKGKGLGLSFLRHIERCKTLVYLIDASAENPFEDFKLLRHELESYDKNLTKKPFFVLLNKIDLLDAKDNIKEFRKKYRFPKKTLLEISALEGDGISSFIQELKNIGSTSFQNKEI